MSFEYELLDIIRALFQQTTLLPCQTKLCVTPSAVHRMKLGQYYIIWTGPAVLELAEIRRGVVQRFARYGQTDEIIVAASRQTFIIRRGDQG